jgi:hypothetical protein
MKKDEYLEILNPPEKQEVLLVIRWDALTGEYGFTVIANEENAAKMTRHVVIGLLYEIAKEISTASEQQTEEQEKEEPDLSN